MTFRLPLVDAPVLDVPLAPREPRRRIALGCVAVVPTRTYELAYAFAEHLVRAARVAGAFPTVIITERIESGTATRHDAPVRARFIEAGAAECLLVRTDAESAHESVTTAISTTRSFVVAIGCDVPAVVVPSFTIAITGGRPLTTWSASARAIRAVLDAELVEPRSDLARGIVAALDREGRLGR